MTTLNHSHTCEAVHALTAILDQFAAGCDPDFDASQEELEREFAELRLHLGNHG